jgi:hypothetical protein
MTQIDKEVVESHARALETEPQFVLYKNTAHLLRNLYAALGAAEAENLALREAARGLADAVKDWSECNDPALVDTIIKDMTAAHAQLRAVLGESE